MFRPIGLVPRSVLVVGADEAPFGTLEDYRGALRDINGNSPFTQPPLKIIEV